MHGIAVALLALAAQIPTYAFDPSREKPPQAAPNDVLVLGTPHLSEIAQSEYPANFDPLLDRLARYRPQIVTIEALSGAQCAYLSTYPSRWTDTIKTYCWDPAPARAATSLDVATATIEAERLLATLGDRPTPAQRRRLAAVFLAAGDRASALVQWLRLPKVERLIGDGLDDALVAILERAKDRHSEDYAIAAPLAARLGLERIYSVDDHTSDFAVADEKAYGATIEKLWSNPATNRRKSIDDRSMAGLSKPGGVLALYRAFNDPAMAPLIYHSDFGAALGDRSPQRFGRRYVAGWEVRNLRMVANIRETLVAMPGSRVITIVGASHKPYFEAYLRQMHDVRLVDAEKILK